MSPEAWIGLAAIILTILGLLMGAAWWMSALYAKVGAIQTNTGNTNKKLDTLTERVDGDVRELRRDVTDLQIRIVRVEGQMDTECEE